MKKSRNCFFFDGFPTFRVITWSQTLTVWLGPCTMFEMEMVTVAENHRESVSFVLAKSLVRYWGERLQVAVECFVYTVDNVTLSSTNLDIDARSSNSWVQFWIHLWWCNCKIYLWLSSRTEYSKLIHLSHYWELYF